VPIGNLFNRLVFAMSDTNIAVGPNHIVETVNLRYAVYNKSGALLW